MANGVGEIYCVELDLRRPFKLPEYCRLFPAEVFAVRKAAEIANNAGNYIKNINIYVDSQTANKTIISHSIAIGRIGAVDRSARLLNQFSKYTSRYTTKFPKGLEVESG